MSRTKKTLTLTFSVIALLLIIWLSIFIKHLTSPSTAKNIIVESTPSTINLSPIEVTSSYVNFSYPQQLSPLPQVPLAGSELANFNFTYKDVETWRLAITVSHVDQSTLNDDSSYSFRVDNPQTYQENTEKVGSNTFYIMTDTQVGGFSKVAFILHGYETADISLYGDDPQGVGGLNSTFQQVLKSWTWNK